MLRDSREIIRRLEREGFRRVSVRGSHQKFHHPDSRRTVTVVHPRRDIPIGTVRSIYRQAVHKDADSCYGVSFPDVPGVITAGDTLDEAIAQAAEVLVFAAEDWEELTGNPFPSPRSLDDLRKDATFQSDCADAVVAAIPFGAGALRPAAE